MDRAFTRHDALFLDLDGTLVDIAPRPEDVVVPHDLPALLERLSFRLDGALAIVSGRPIRDIDRFLAPFAPIAAGIHGAELRSVVQGEIHSKAPPIEATLYRMVQRVAAAHAGAFVESKRTSIAVHYRHAPAAGLLIEVALRRILEEGHLDHLELVHGRKVLEIVHRHVSKGSALASLMELPAFSRRRPVMIGDDVTDQSAFAAATRLGGVGLKVAGELFSTAEADFAGPAEVRAWLARIAEGPST